MSTLPWWEWRFPRERLALWLKAILGGRRYRVQLEPDFPSAGAISGEDGHRLILNPTWWTEEIYRKWLDEGAQLHPTPFRIRDWKTWSWLCCKAVGAHEVGHAYFTETPPAESLLAWVVNALEDERVERGMIVRYPVLAPYFDLAGDAQWVDLEPTPAGHRDTAHGVLQAVILWRWEHDLPDLGERSKIQLSPVMSELWEEEVRPLVETAWVSPTFPEVVELARRILEILGMSPEKFESDDEVEAPEWFKKLVMALLDLLSGHQLNPAGAVGLALSDGDLGFPSGKNIEDLPPVPASDNPSRGMVQPVPFGELEATVTPWVRQLVAELAVPTPDVEPEPAAYGGRLSLRQVLRDPARPFMAPEGQAPDVEGLAVEILGDRSGSMGWSDEPKMKAAQAGVMTLHLACLDLGIPHAISLFDDEVLIKDYGHRSEMTKALIAGWSGETGEEHIDRLMRLRGPQLLRRPEHIKVMLVIHDGTPVVDGESDRIRAWIAAHPQVFVVGVYLAEDLSSHRAGEEAAKMAKLFTRLVVAEPATLPQKLGAVLRAIRPQYV